MGLPTQLSPENRGYAHADDYGGSGTTVIRKDFVQVFLIICGFDFADEYGARSCFL